MKFVFQIIFVGYFLVAVIMSFKTNGDPVWINSVGGWGCASIAHFMYSRRAG